jgi:hypothetical protein
VPSARHEYSAEEFEVYFTRGILADVQRAFTEAGRPQAAEPLIAAFKQKVKIVADPTADIRAAWENPRKLVTVDFLPPNLKPELKPVMFPGKPSVDGVVALKFNEGMLWVSTRAGAMTWSDPAWEYLTRSHTNAAVWRLSANSSTPEMISSKLGQHSKVTSFCAQNDKLWMTLEQDGVFCLSPETLQNTRYGDKQGVLSRQMFASALVGKRLYFGGGEPNSGKLNYVELPGRLWKSQDLGSEIGAQIVLLQPFGNNLLVNDRILNTGSGVWRSVRDELLGGNAPPFNSGMPTREFELLAATADTNALWLGHTLGLISYNPDTGAQHHCFSVWGGYLVDARSGAATNAMPTSRLPGSVTALVNDGDFLWVAATTRFDPSLNGNGSEGRWVNGYLVLTLRPGCFGYGGGGNSGGWRNMYAKNERNYVLLLHKPTGKWVGYFPVTSRVTSLAVSGEKLWIGLEATGYVALGEHSWEDDERFVPSPLIEVRKLPLLAISPSEWIPDEVTPTELKVRIQQAIQALK